MYRRILLPTDGSPQADEAAEHAIDLAARYDATLHVLFVVDTAALPLDVHSEGLFERIEEEGRLSMDEILTRAHERGVDPVVTDVVRGSPAAEIIDYVPANDVDLIVMGTHGRHGVDRYILGSVTERVVREAAVPVLTVRTGPAA